MGIRHERCRMSTTVALRGHSNRVAGCTLSGVKRTCRFASQMSAYDPKRTCPLRREYLCDAAFRAPNLGLSTMFLV